jgi:hypothetical protein
MVRSSCSAWWLSGRSEYSTDLLGRLGTCRLARHRRSCRSKVAGNLFGINEPWQCTFIPMGGPPAHVNSVENPLLHLQFVCSGNRVYGCDCDFVAELEKRSRQHLSAFLLGLGIRFAASLDKSHPLVQYLPNHAAEPMSDSPDGGLIAQPRQQTPEHRLKMSSDQSLDPKPGL